MIFLPARRGIRLYSRVMEIVGLCILALLALPLIVAIRRSTELFVIDVRAGKATLRRGRVPAALLDDIRDVVARPPSVTARIRAVTDGGSARVLPDPGLSDDRLQQLRNVVGRFKPVQIRSGRGR